MEPNLQERLTLTAAATASPTSPGEACHVPRPTDGILAPVLSSKYLSAFAIIREASEDKTKSN